MGSLKDMGLCARLAFLALLGALAQAALALLLRHLRPDDWLSILSAASVLLAPLYAWLCARPLALRSLELAEKARQSGQGEQAMVERVDWGDELAEAEGAYNRLVSSFRMRESKLQVARDGARLTNQKLEKRTLELELLYDISVGLKEIYDPSSALSLCLDKAVEVLECEWAAYLGLDHETSTVAMESVRGFTSEMTTEVRMALWRGNVFPQAETLSAQVGNAGETLFSHSIAKGRKFRDYAEFRNTTHPISAFMAVPVLNRQGLAQGVLLAVNRRDSQNFTRTDADLGAELSRLLFLALDKTNAFQKGFRDPRTGLFVREYMVQRLSEEIRLSGRDSREVSLVVFGPDDPESVSVKGEAFVESFNQAIGEILFRALRTVDIACRFTEMNFAAVLPDTSARGAMVLGARLLETLSSGPIPGGQSDSPGSGHTGIHMCFSMGIKTTTWKQLSGADQESVIRDAITAMEQARRQGGSRLLCHEKSFDDQVSPDDQDSSDQQSIKINLDAGGDSIGKKKRKKQDA